LFTPLMDRELELLNLIRRDWWALAIAVCVVWAIECQLEGNSGFETLAAPLLVCVWLGVIFLLDRWILRITGRRNG
jgi:hypothetical protein